MKVSSEKELGQAVRDGADHIEIEGDLAKKTIRIHATGKVAWAVCFSALAIAVAAVLLTVGSAGVAAPVATVGVLPVAGAAAAILGLPAATAAIAIAVAGGGVGVLNKLRNYNLVKNENGVVLKRK